ncbi:MAG: hypothetical protein A2583_10985 [Bdellovibrionales bacterium RIFOXYD1_FULL_53_11]|nr:MAG: hypothetical protein A2583_10985 [Bdellovibrionales bacterium RIFOXYD1_FULL_53_11]
MNGALVKRTMLPVVFAAVVAWLGVGLSPARASVHQLPESVLAEALSETVPTAFEPVDFSAADFTVEWVGRPVPGVEYRLGRRSFEWVRSGEVFLLPRGSLIVSVENTTGGQLVNGGFVQALAVEGARGTAELPVALVSGAHNAIRVVVRRPGAGEMTGELRIRFKPAKKRDNALVFVDHSCSSSMVSASSTGARPDEWVYIGCRQVFAEGDSHRVTSLEMFVFWENGGENVSTEGVAITPAQPYVWRLRLRSKPGSITLRSGLHGMKISYGIAEKMRLGNMGVGLGPYTYYYDAKGHAADTYAPVATMYVSYFILETMRLVAFNATVAHSSWNTDLGVYVNYESIRVLDRRLSLNVMLGGHGLVYKYGGKVHTSFGFPQGVEVIFRDAFKRRCNLAFGAFVYPLIDKKSYYNLWVRWGSSYFAEINYISWHESPDERDRIYMRSAGISFGMPLFSFL